MTSVERGWIGWADVKISSGLGAKALDSDSLIVDLGVATYKLRDLGQVTTRFWSFRFFICKLGK